MRQQILMPMAVAALVLGAGAFNEAHAGSPWEVFGDVRVGGIHFSVGFQSYRGDHYGGYARPYYRTSHRLRYRGRRCGSFCFRERDHYYHHQSCPLLGAHFERHNFQPRFQSYGYRDRGYGRYRRDYYDDDYRYDRRRFRRGRRGRW